MDQPRRVLIVDDDEVNRALLQRLVSTFGHLPLVAASGFQALELMTPEVDLVLLDAMMPGMDGFEVARRIRADATVGQVPIIMVTALSEKEDRLRAVEAGASDFVPKPIDRTELRVRMASLLKMKEAQDAIRHHERELDAANAELRRKNERMETDLNLAREIQQSFMPKQYPLFFDHREPGQRSLSFCHRWIPTTTLGGDFFDVLAISPTLAGVFISDVMGHGVRSALVTAMMRAMVQDHNPAVQDPGRFLAAINDQLLHILQQTRTAMFASAFYMVIDVASGTLHYANAGHPSPLWLRRSRAEVVPLVADAAACGPALGICADSEYGTAYCNLEVGDSILLFTDGLFEVEADENEYGESGLLTTVGRNLDLEPDPLFDTLLLDVKSFGKCEEFEDDVCLLSVELH